MVPISPSYLSSPPVHPNCASAPASTQLWMRRKTSKMGNECYLQQKETTDPFVTKIPCIHRRQKAWVGNAERSSVLLEFNPGREL